MITWALAYSSMGSADGVQVTTELLKASLSSGYFAVCMYLMYRLYRHQAIALPWLSSILESKESRSAKRDQKPDN